MRKRSAQEAGSGGKAETGVGGLKSRSGRVVKPKLFEDGTVAMPVAVLKEDAPEAQEREGGDPDYQAPQEQEAERGMSAEAHPDSEDEALSEEGPVASIRSREGSRNSGRAQRSGSVGRDESGKFTSGGRPRAGGARGGGRGRGESGGGIFKMAAVEVLRQEKRLMSTGEIARVALKRGLIKCTGKTPEATMASALYTDIKRKEGQSVFIRPHEGLFGLREWIEQGVVFQDDYAEEMAKRARATFGAYMGLPGLPPLMGPPPPHHPAVPAHGDQEAAALAGAAAAAAAAGAPFHHPAMMGYAGLPQGLPMPPLVPGREGYPGAYTQGLSPGSLAGMMAGMVHPLAPGAHGEHAKGSESPDGLMELLSAAEELHRSNSKDKEGEEGKRAREERAPATAEAREKTAPKSAPQPAAAVAAPAGSPGERAAAEAGQPAEGEAKPEGESAGDGTPTVAEAELPGPTDADFPMDLEPALQQQQQQDGGEEAGAAAEPQHAGAEEEGEEGAGEEDEAAALLAAVAAEYGAGVSKEGTPETAGLPFPGFQGAGHYPYHPYAAHPYAPYPYHPYYPYAGMPPPPPAAAARGGRRGGRQAAHAEAEQHEDEAGEGLLGQLVVRGSNKPFAGPGSTQRGPAPITGQEQVNILNLPLPDIDAAADGPGSSDEQAQGEAEGAQAGSRVSAEQLKQAEAQVMRLEKEMGAEHPEVGKAYLSLSRLYVADCADSTAKQLAEAALGRAYDIMTSCQMSLQRGPACTSSFSYLLDKIRTAAPLPSARPRGHAVANGDAAHVALPNGVAAH